MTFQGFFVEMRRIERVCRRDRAVTVAERMARIDQRLGDRPIDQPGVEMAQGKMRREPFPERALAGSGRSVDRDDHEYSAPRRRIIATKPGKLVWMKAVSSTCTGLSLARPMTSADIAMR